MTGVNKAIILGHVGRDPEIKRLEGGKIVARFSIATTEKFKDSLDVWHERTEWHTIQFWGATVENVIEKYVKKGSLLYVEGKLTTQKYTKESVDHYTTFIMGNQIQLLSKSNNEAPIQDPTLAPSAGEQPTDDLPF